MSDDIVAFTSAHLFAFACSAAVATPTRAAAPNLTAALYNPQVYELGRPAR